MYLAVCLLDYLSDRQSSSHSADEPFLFSCCSESGKLSVRIRWQQDFMIMVMRLIVNADKHSPALSARGTKRWNAYVSGSWKPRWQGAKRLRSWNIIRGTRLRNVVRRDPFTGGFLTSLDSLWFYKQRSGLRISALTSGCTRNIWRARSCNISLHSVSIPSFKTFFLYFVHHARWYCRE